MNGIRISDTSNNCSEQECIPVGCVPSTTVAFCWGCTWSREGCTYQGGVPGPRGCTCLGAVPGSEGGVPGPGGRGGGVPGPVGYLPRYSPCEPAQGCTCRGVYLVPGGCTWPRGLYLVLGGRYLPRYSPCERND